MSVLTPPETNKLERIAKVVNASIRDNRETTQVLVKTLLPHSRKILG